MCEIKFRSESGAMMYGEVIPFTREYKSYGELCNSYVVEGGIEYNGKRYPTAEHLYQSFKYMYPDAPLANQAYIEVIRSQATARDAEIVGSLQARPNDPQRLRDIIKKYVELGVMQNSKWEESRLLKMYQTLRLKFRPDTIQRYMLLQTGDATLVYVSKSNPLWGCDSIENFGTPDAIGFNMLGFLLSKLRKEIRKQQE